MRERERENTILAETKCRRGPLSHAETRVIFGSPRRVSCNVSSLTWLSLSLGEGDPGLKLTLCFRRRVQFLSFCISWVCWSRTKTSPANVFIKLVLNWPANYLQLNFKVGYDLPVWPWLGLRFNRGRHPPILYRCPQICGNGKRETVTTRLVMSKVMS